MYVLVKEPVFLQAIVFWLCEAEVEEKLDIWVKNLWYNRRKKKVRLTSKHLIVPRYRGLEDWPHMRGWLKTRMFGQPLFLGCAPGGEIDLSKYVTWTLQILSFSILYLYNNGFNYYRKEKYLITCHVPEWTCLALTWESQSEFLFNWRAQVYMPLRFSYDVQCSCNLLFPLWPISSLWSFGRMVDFV